MNTRKLGLFAVIIFSVILIKTIFFRPKPPIEFPSNFQPTVIHDTISLFGKHLPTDSIQLGQDGHSDSMLVRVDSFSFWREPSNALFKLRDDMRYWTAHFTLANQGKAYRHPNQFDCWIVDEHDSAYGPAIGVARREPNIDIPDSLAPGASAKGWVTFALRKNDHPIDLRYEEVMNAQPVKIMLPANKKS